MKHLCAILMLVAGDAAAETVVSNRTIRPQQIITSQDVRMEQQIIQGAYDNMEHVLGQEAKHIIYPGRAIMIGSVGTPALVERNQIVELIFESGGLRIVAEGKALGRGAAGERIRVMNSDSRTVLFGEIHPDGSIVVSN